MLSPWVVWPAATLGAWSGHLLWFSVGRRLGATALVSAWPRLERRVAQADRIVRAHPRTAIFLLQYLYGMRLVGAVGFGLTSLPFARFALYEAVNCMLWAALFMGLGFALGEAAITVLSGELRWVWIGASVLVLMAVFHWASVSAAGRIGDRGDR